MTDPTPTLPCPNECEDGTVWIDEGGGEGHKKDCAVCGGNGFVEEWRCQDCDEPYDTCVWMPVSLEGEPFICACCVDAVGSGMSKQGQACDELWSAMRDHTPTLDGVDETAKRRILGALRLIRDQMHEQVKEQAKCNSTPNNASK